MKKEIEDNNDRGHMALFMVLLIGMAMGIGFIAGNLFYGLFYCAS